MAKGVSIQVKGLNELRKKIGRIPETVTRMVDAEMADAANEFVNRAVAAVPVNDGLLKGGITSGKVADMKYEITSARHYSAYVEFGTITRVQVPRGLETYALQFKGRGIKKTGGMRARPFFFPQLPIARAELNRNLKNVIRQALK